ncbi:MAG: dehydrogenase E1 component subunit alpha/beta [Planctomycetota bacterium]
MRKYHAQPGRITFDPIDVFRVEPDLRDLIKTGDLTPARACDMLREMMKIRQFEEKIVQLKMGLDPKRPGYNFVGASHLYAGEEAVAVGAVSALAPDDYITSTHRGHGHCIAKGGDLKRMMAELIGKRTGYCKGKGGSMHIADMSANNLGANGVVAGSYGIATGAGIVCRRLHPGRIVVSFAGDGATNNGIAHEAVNMASALKVPVIFLIENNGVGMTGPVHEVTNIRDYLVRRAAAYNMKGEVVDGMNVLAVHEAVKRYAALIRKDPQPVMIEAVTFRIYGHSLSDNRRSYRTREEEDHWHANDAILQYADRLVAAGLMTAVEVTAMEAGVKQLVEEAMDFADASPYPDPAEVTDDVYALSTSEGIGETWKSDVKFVPCERDKENKLFFWQAVNEGIREEMVRDRRVVMFGEDIAAYGGAFGVSRGLVELFGRERIWNTPISEAAIAGSGAGAALTGLRPIVELMYIDFTTIAMDQIVNQAAKIRYMFGGMATVPMVIRVPIGGGKGYAGQHSQSLESWFTHVPGLKVVAPASPRDAKGLLKTAIRDDNPVMFIEHQLLYGEKSIKETVPLEEYTIPFGVADIKRPGKDVTIVTYSYMVVIALQAAAKLAAEHGVEAEVVDLRTLNPLDINTVVASVRKTGKAIVLAQSCRTGSFAAEIASQIQELAFDHLDAPVRRIGAKDSPPPMSPTLEEAFLPQAADVVRVALDLVKHKGSSGN